MYGMVNKAIKGLIVDNYNTETWREICDKSDFFDYEFAGLKSYPDELTYKLVGNASEVLSIEKAKLLEMFGEYWITYTAEEGYGNLIQIAGSTFGEVLSNLNMLHERLSHIMPSLKPPIFNSKLISENNIELEYQSTRAGFAPMVKGLIIGLGKKYNHDVEVKIASESMSNEYFNVVYQLTWN